MSVAHCFIRLGVCNTHCNSMQCSLFLFVLTPSTVYSPPSPPPPRTLPPTTPPYPYIHPPTRQVFFDTFLLYDMTSASPAALRGIGVLTDLCDGAAAGKPAPLPPRAPEEGVDPEESRKDPVVTEKGGLDRVTPTPPKGEPPPSWTG